MAEKAKKNLNERIAELDRKVEWFYSDDFELEKAVEKYKETAELAKKIKADLEALKNKIEILDTDFSK